MTSMLKDTSKSLSAKPEKSRHGKVPPRALYGCLAPFGTSKYPLSDPL